MLLAILALAGCETVENCPHFPRSDCCHDHGECFDFYGNALPYCRAPERDIGGSCSECIVDADCAEGTCEIDSNGSGGCVTPGR